MTDRAGLVLVSAQAPVARVFIAVALGVAALFITLAAMLVYVVDPFQRFRVPERFTPHYYWLYKRQLNPGMVRNERYDILVTGTSLMENFSNRETSGALGGQAINAAMGAMSAYEMRRLLEVALATGKPRVVVLDIGPNSFNGPVGMVFTPNPLPEYLYQDGRWNDLHYLLQITPLLQSVDMALDLDGYEISRDRDKPWYWAGNYSFSRASAIRGLDPANLNRRYGFRPLDVSVMATSFDDNLMSLLARHPATTFKLVLPPVSILAWVDFRQRGQLDNALAFRRHVAQRIADLGNVELHDFQADLPVITELDHYKDMFHFSPEISRRMMLAVANNTFRADVSAVERNNLKITTMAGTIDIATYFAATSD